MVRKRKKAISKRRLEFSFKIPSLKKVTDKEIREKLKERRERTKERIAKARGR